MQTKLQNVGKPQTWLESEDQKSTKDFTTSQLQVILYDNAQDNVRH